MQLMPSPLEGFRCPVSSVTFAISFQFSKFGRGQTPRTKHRGRTPRTNTADEHFSFFVRSGRSPSPIVAAPRRGRTRFLPHLRIRLAKDICCVAKKRVFTRKASLPCLPGDVSPDRHAARDRHWPSFTGGCAVGVEKGRKLDSVRTGGNSKVVFRLPCEA